jgi:hypothetical protein
VARNGRVDETGDPLAPFRLVDEQGAEAPAQLPRLDQIEVTEIH